MASPPYNGCECSRRFGTLRNTFLSMGSATAASSALSPKPLGLSPGLHLSNLMRLSYLSLEADTLLGFNAYSSPVPLGSMLLTLHTSQSLSIFHPRLPHTHLFEHLRGEVGESHLWAVLCCWRMQLETFWPKESLTVLRGSLSIVSDALDVSRGHNTSLFCCAVPLKSPQLHITLGKWSPFILSGRSPLGPIRFWYCWAPGFHLCWADFSCPASFFQGPFQMTTA